MTNNMLLTDLVPEGGWLKRDTPRLTPLQDEEMSIPKRSMLYLMLRIGKAKCPNLFRTMFRNFRVYFPFARFNARIMPYGKLARRHTELAILRVAWRTRSYYEWGQHIEIGLRNGLTPNDIVRVTLGPETEGWDDCEQSIIRAVDEFIEEKVLSDNTWETLSSHLNENQVIELMFTVSSYIALACVLNSVGVELEPEIKQVLSRIEVPLT